MRLNARLARSICCLCLPTLVVVAFAIRFACVDLPRIVADERERVFALSESAARELLNDPASADFVWRRGSGVVRGTSEDAARYPSELSWKDWAPQGRAKTKVMWGFSRRPGGRFVWVRDTTPGGDPNVVYGRETALVERDYATMILVFGGLSLLVLIGVTATGVRYFVESVRTRDDFMAAAAHDLTTPLVGLRYAIGRDDEEARRLNERLLRLVENVKDFMRLGGRRRAPAREPVDLRRAYDEAYAVFREDFRDLFDGADVPVAMPAEGAGVVVAGDATMCVQILWNLLGNDLKYAAPYGAVRVVFRREDGRIAVDFIDEGKGMTPRQMRRAFDRYYRAKTVLESGKGGFGIGLCTAREFAEAMGGTLTVRANEPTGCVFTLTLPAVTVV